MPKNKPRKKITIVRRGRVTAEKFREYAKNLEGLSGQLLAIATWIEATKEMTGSDYIVLDGIRKADKGIVELDRFVENAISAKR